MFIFLTGLDGVGKTTVAWRAVPALRARGLTVAGFVSPSLLDGNGRKTGIEMVDLTTGQRRIFARVVGPGEAVTVGVYRLTDGATEWAQAVLLAALAANADCLVVDEIGPLELCRGGGFTFALELLADSQRVPNAIVVVCESLVGELAERLGRADIVPVRVTEAGRPQVGAQLADLLRPRK